MLPHFLFEFLGKKGKKGKPPKNPAYLHLSSYPYFHSHLPSLPPPLLPPPPLPPPPPPPPPLPLPPPLPPLLLLPLPLQPSVQLFLLLLPYFTPLVSDPMRSSTCRTLVGAPWAVSCFVRSGAPPTPWVGFTFALNMPIMVTFVTPHWLLHLNEWSWVGSVSPNDENSLSDYLLCHFP